MAKKLYLSTCTTEDLHELYEKVAESKNLSEQKKVAVQNTIFSLKIPSLAGFCSKYRNNYF